VSADARLRVGFAAPYFTLVEPRMGAGYRDRRRAEAGGWARALGEEFDVSDGELITSLEDGEHAGELFASRGVDVVVLAPTMVAPPAHAIAALDGAGAPAVLWMVPGFPRLPDELRPEQAAGNSMSVGATMIGNVLVRRARPFAAIAAAPDDRAAMSRLRRVVRAAGAAGRLRGAVALRIGDPVDGYLDVESSEAELAALGVREHRIDADELAQAFSAVGTGTARELLAELRSRDWHLGEFPLLEDSARLAVAVGELVERAGAVCGTVNCHSACLRFSETVGIPACLAVSVLTGRGIPFSCTGDQPTALALLLARVLSGAALYCELNSAESQTGLALLSAGGEGDPAWLASGGRVAVEPNRFFPGGRGDGAGVSFPVAAGPATLLSLSPVAAGWRLVWATGEVEESRYGSSLETPNAMFRFDSGPAVEACEAWTRSGATHHAALAAGRLDLEVEVVGAALGVETRRL